MVLSGGQSITQYVAHITIPQVMLAVYASSFLSLKILQSCSSPPVFVFQLLIGVNQTTVFPGRYSQPWMIHILSRFVMQNFHFRLAFIEHSCSSLLYRNSQHVSAPKRMENRREDRNGGQKKCIWQLYTYPSVCSLSLNQWALILIYKK